MQRIFLLFSVIFLLIDPSFAWQTIPATRHFTQDNGLPTNNINEIFQDKTGYIWMATGEGICRYDGYTYKNYHATQGITDNNVRFIEQDRTGRVWFATLKNNIYYLDHDVIKPFKYNKKITESKGVYQDFKISDDGTTLYLAMGRSGLVVIDTTGRKSILPQNHINSKVILEKENIIISSFNNKFDAPDSTVWKPNTIEWVGPNGVTQIKLDSKIMEGSTHIFAVKYGSKGRLVIFGKKLFYFENQEYLWSISLPSIKSIPFVDSYGHIYIALLENNGVRKYENLQSLRDDNYRNILPDKSVTWISQDRDNGIWISTIDDGYYYMPNSNINTWELPSSMSGQKMKSITPGEKGQYYVGLSSGDIASVNPNGVEAILLPESPYPTTVFSMYYDKEDKRLYAATNYLQYFEFGHWNATSYPNDRGIPGQFITYRDKNQIFCKTGQYGNLVENTFVKIKYQWASQNNLSELRAFTISKDSTIWVSTIDGIFCASKAELKFRKPIPQHSAFDVSADFMHMSKTGVLIFGNGQQIFYLMNGKVHNIVSKIIGFPGNDVRLAETTDGNIWIASGLGCMVYKIDKKGYQEQFISKNLGLPDDQIFDITYDGDRIWLVTDKILISVPDTMYQSKLITPVLESFLVNDSLIAIKNYSHFSYDKNNITIGLNTFNYRMGERSQFRYRLHATSPWQVTNSKEIKLFSLQDGEYPLEIQAKNEDGIWGDSLHIDFSIAPIFYKSWWFLSLVFIFILAAGYGYYRFRIRTLQKEAIVQTQINTLERSALQAQMNPHFIFNCLSSIQHFILQNDKENANQYLTTFASLVRDTLNASVDSVVSLEDEIRMLESYLALERLRFSYSFDYHINVSPDIDQYDTVLPPLLIQPFVENAILHGMKNQSRQGKIDISFTNDNKFLRVTIIDNGTGIQRNEQPNSDHEEANKNHGYKSLGVGITKKRLSHLNSHSIDEDLTITEIKDDKGLVIGSKVMISIKI